MVAEVASRPKNGDTVKEVMAVLDAKLTRQFAVNMHACVHCGLCFESCHYYLATGDPKLTPAYKAEQLRQLYKRRHDWTGKLLPWWVHAEEATEERLAKLYDVAFGSCTMCRRCNFNCPMGLDMGLMMRTARAALTSVGMIPKGLKDTVDIHLATGNNMGITPEDFVETVEWIEEELQKELGDPTYTIPIDKPGTRYLMCLNPREVKFYPLLFRAQFLTCYAAGEQWGVSSKAWDATNYGLFSGDDAACKQIITHLMDEAERLGVHTIVATECGHGYRSLRWEGQGWYGKPLPVNVMSYVELTAQHIQEGRLKLDPSKNSEPVTYHDPCNQARSGGIVDEPRYILNRTVTDFREMTPHGTENFCCGGGGGALTMAEFRDRRLEVARIKAEQIRATGAKIVATSCHNCIDQLTEISRHYKLGVKVVNICELVANALILPPKQVAVPTPELVAPVAVAVDGNGFIADPAAWSRGAAQFIAGRQGYGQALERLDTDHWRVVEYMRSYYTQAGVAPSREQICGELKLTGKRFHELFPGTMRTALRIAGLPAAAAAESVEESAVP